LLSLWLQRIKKGKVRLFEFLYPFLKSKKPFILSQREKLGKGVKRGKKITQNKRRDKIKVFNLLRNKVG
jgi:CCR4-NOT transcriptional regulation complex NOT5 subunit